MDPLESVLRPVVAIMNRNIQESTPARALCSDLSGSVFAIRVRDTALAAYFNVHDDVIDMQGVSEAEPDVVISGSLVSLSRMLANSDASMLRDGSIELTGDAEKAQQFQALLKHSRPDLEEELANVIGDVAAHRLGRIGKGLRRWSRDARSTMGANIREYLQEESRETPSRFETDEFAASVGALRDDVDRVEARLRRLQREDAGLE